MSGLVWTKEVMESNIIVMDTYKELTCVFLAERLTRNKGVSPEEKMSRWKIVQNKFRILKDVDSDQYVEEHIACCYECRQLAEALRPSVNLIHEAMREDRESLPSYQGTSASASSAWSFSC